MKMMKVWIGMMAVFMAVSAFADDPTISDVVARQRWPWSRLVDIDYVLTCDATQKIDIAVSGYNGTVPLTLPVASLTGDLYGLSSGSHRIVWDPTVTAYTNEGVLGKFRVALTPTAAPLYMIVDLTKAAGAADQIEYVYSGDERLETYGRFTNVWFGVTNDSVYATDKLVLRRVHAGTFGMGDNANIPTTLTKDFYAGVFEVTQYQWNKMMEKWPSYLNNTTCRDKRPVEQAAYDDIRGGGALTGGGWPTNASVSGSSFVGQMRAKTRIAGFDLPTEAQWEYACRAGTSTYYNDGLETPLNTDSNAQMNVLGRYKFNGGYINGTTPPPADCITTNGTSEVGVYLPNAWGVYDMHGNVYEWCLDWAGGSAGGIDPLGPEVGTQRILCSGSWCDPAYKCSTTYRINQAPGTIWRNFGFRVVVNLP